MIFINHYKGEKTMLCPVCENETASGICPICGYELENDIMINKLSYQLSNKEIINYQTKIKHLKDIYHQNKINHVNERSSLTFDDNLVVKYYQHDASLGDVEAMEKLGRIYEEGEIAEQDIDKAVEYYQQAAKLDNIEALFHLANMYHQGKNIGKDLEKAVKYYQRLSKLNSDELLLNYYIESAVNNLGDIYYEQNDYLQAKKYYDQAFSRWKSREAASRLALMYEYGLGVAKDKIKAEEYANYVNIVWKL